MAALVVILVFFGIGYALGVVATFLALAGVLLALRAGGEQKVRDEWVAELKKKDLDAEAFGAKYSELVETASAEFPDEDKSGVQRCIETQS